MNGRSWFWTAIVLVSMAALVPAPTGAQTPEDLTIGAAPVGGVYYIAGGGFAELISETLGIQTSVMMTVVNTGYGAEEIITLGRHTPDNFIAMSTHGPVGYSALGLGKRD